MRIDESPYACAPREDPACYPGAIPTGSYLFLGEVFLPLLGATGDFAERFRVGSDAGPMLASLLASTGATETARRRALLAYGSNASPAQLRSKLVGTSVDPVVPVLAVRVAGLEVVYSAHRSPYGAVPATVVPAAGSVSRLHVCLLDDAQLEVLATTEPNYVQEPLTADVSIVLDTGVDVDGCTLFVSRHGPTLVDGEPRRLPHVPAQGSRYPTATQTQAQTWVRSTTAATSAGSTPPG